MLFTFLYSTHSFLSNGQCTREILTNFHNWNTKQSIVLETLFVSCIQKYLKIKTIVKFVENFRIPIKYIHEYNTSYGGIPI